jgi:hypothetical protein
MAEIVNTPAPADHPIRIPEWDDVLHVKPRAALTSADKRAWSRYLDDTGGKAKKVEQLRIDVDALYARGDDVGGLTRDQVNAALRGRQLYQDMRMSQVPQWRQNMIKVLTVLDNIEDDISTVEWVTRPVTRKWAPTRALSEITRRVSTQLDEIQKVIAGPTLARALMKRKAANGRRRSARAAKGKFSLIQRGASWIKANQGHLLEAGQSLDNHLGVGLQLGAIMGALEETQDRLIISAWNGAKFAVGKAAAFIPGLPADTREDLRRNADLAANRVAHVGGPLIGQALDFLATQAAGFDFFGAAGRKAAAAAVLQTDNDTYTRAEHALALHASAVTLPLMAQLYNHAMQTLDPEHVAGIDAPAPRLTSELARELAIEAGATLTPDGRPTGQWQEPTISLHAYLDQAIDQASQARATWLPVNVGHDHEQLVHSLLEINRLGTALVLTGREDGLRVIPDPTARAELYLWDLDAAPPADTPRQILEAWLAAQLTAIEAEPDAYNARTWARITAQFWPIPHLVAS